MGDLRDEVNNLMREYEDIEDQIRILNDSFDHFMKEGGKISFLIYPKESTSTRCETTIEPDVGLFIVNTLISRYKDRLNSIRNSINQILRGKET